MAALDHNIVSKDDVLITNYIQLMGNELPFIGVIHQGRRTGYSIAFNDRAKLKEAIAFLTGADEYLSEQEIRMKALTKARVRAAKNAERRAKYQLKKMGGR